MKKHVSEHQGSNEYVRGGFVSDFLINYHNNLLFIVSKYSRIRSVVIKGA